ncbi:acetylcholine receptor subunit beta-type unc-29-like [Ostrea edulis]|uniref:acetylcholine receptor subunit beta-type unc-29-like n=1 Tax=Ostrea edulis TaxID=37623 RepID=UPI002094A1B5|nr:acetylcholine receptor subunit beta-type unc-29-like [Ostrea edulis]
MKTLNNLLWFSLLTCRIYTVRATRYSDAESLLQNIFTNYSTDLRPNTNYSEVTNVSVHPFVFSVNDFDEVSGVISIVVGFMLKWHDFRLTWTPSNYGGIMEFPITPKKLWVPKIFLADPANKMEAVGSADFVGRIYHNGLVSWLPGCLIQTLCSVNMYRFPFDIQKCSFTLTPWGYLPLEVKLIPSNGMSFVDTTYYSSNAQWTLEGTRMKRSAKREYDSLIEIQLILKRKSLYFVINMLAPILLLSLLNPLVFALPIDSGERISYAITIYLSFAVFLTLLNDNIPKSSESMSLMSYFLLEIMSMSTVICILTILTMHFHFKESHSKLSGRAVFILNVLRLHFLRQCRRKRIKKTTVHGTAGLGDDANSKISDEDELEDGDSITWKTLAEGYDKVMMYYFYLLVFLQWFILSAILVL